MLYPYLENATIAFAELDTISHSIPNIDLFTYMYVRKEALLLSQIEGALSSFSDLILFEHNQKTNVSIEGVSEVSDYVKTINYECERLKDNFSMLLRLLKNTHLVLLSGTSGSAKLPGEFRRSQNWIGCTRPGNALFVTPPYEYMMESLSDFEKFLHTINCLFW